MIILLTDSSESLMPRPQDISSWPVLTRPRHNNKTLDLSRTTRLSGLSHGAKLELVLRSRSPSVVSVALQLPNPDASGSSRLTDKFPSTTTLWLILRAFESADGSKRNFTARGVPQLQAQASGAGRLCFETPVIQLLGRELSSFSDLQKTLAQLGINSGSALLRLTFKNTDTPLEEAMAEIGQYFKEVEGSGSQKVHTSGLEDIAASRAPSGTISSPEATDGPSPPTPPSLDSSCSPLQTNSTMDPSTLDQFAENDRSSELDVPASDIVTGPSLRAMSVFAPSSASTLKAAQQPFNERDYEPTTDHAKLHQSRLSATGASKRLPSDVEIAAEATAQAKKMAGVKEVEIKIRFPDQMQVISTFSNVDTASTLYDFVKHLMTREDEPFLLRFSTAKGPRTVPKGAENSARLIGGLGMSGRVLINVVWEDGASSEARGGNVLKDQYQEKAKEIEVKQFDPLAAEGAGETSEFKGKNRDGREKKPGMPKWLKLPGKK